MNRLIQLVTNLHSHQHWVLSLVNSPNSKTQNRCVHLVTSPLHLCCRRILLVTRQSSSRRLNRPSHPARDQPPLSPVPCFVTGQQSMQQDLEPLSSMVTFASLIPIPHRDRPTTKRQRRKHLSCELTSDERLAFVAERSKPKTSKKVQKAKPSSGKEAVKPKVKPKKCKVQEKDQQANRASSEPDNTTCLYCEIAYSESHVA